MSGPQAYGMVLLTMVSSAHLNELKNTPRDMSQGPSLK